jgi:hypothetical protein
VNGFLTVLAWIWSGLRRRRRPELRETEDDHLAERGEDLAERGEDLAQLQDHSVDAARPPEGLAQRDGLLAPQHESPPAPRDDSPSLAQGEDPEPALAQSDDSLAQREQPDAQQREGPDDPIATPVRVDTAAWEATTSIEWSCWRGLVTDAKTRSSVEWVDVFGEVVTLAIDRGRPGSGAIVLQTGTTRVEITRTRAEVQITSLASETEGLESWGLRWLPRFAWWLFGQKIDVDTCEELGNELAKLGVTQRWIDPCCDVLRHQIKSGDEKGLISSAEKWQKWTSDDDTNGFGAGEKKSTPNSMNVYDKIKKLRRARGPEREALFARWERFGWKRGMPVTRIEPRIQKKGLVLRGLDATHPGAAFNSEIVGALFVDSLSRHRLIDLSSKPRARQRDRDEHPVWVLARAAGGSAEPIRLQREVVRRQARALRQHAIQRLGRAGADVDELLHGNGDGSKALETLERLIGGEEWVSDRARSRARYSELLEQEGTD